MATTMGPVSALLLATSLILRFAVGTSSSLQVGDDAEPYTPQALFSARSQMTRLEPKFVTVAEKIAHHVKRSTSRAAVLRRRMEKPAGPGSVFESAVHESPGGYTMSLLLGSPPQTFNLLADTGSDLTWVQASTCHVCFAQPSRSYDQRRSSTYTALPCSGDMCTALGIQSSCVDGSGALDGNCHYAYMYGDLSTTLGDFSTETITLETTAGERVAVSDFAFGVGLENSDFDDVDGIVGLGQGPISFPSQLGERYGRVFSYCLQSVDSDPARSSPIIFGRSAVPESGSVEYTALQTPSDENPLLSTFWFVGLEGASLTMKDGEVSKCVPTRNPGREGSMGTVIDSGTTLSMLDPDVYNCLATSIASVVSYAPVLVALDGDLTILCFDTVGSSDRDQENPDFPQISLSFQDGAEWVLPRDNVFIRFEDTLSSSPIWCLAMLPTNQNIQIIGNIQQQNFQVIYDQPNGRIGWMPATCDRM